MLRVVQWGIWTYNAHVKCSSSCLIISWHSCSANCDIIILLDWSSFFLSASIRSSSSPFRSSRSCALSRKCFSRRSNSAKVIRFNRRRSAPEDVGVFEVDEPSSSKPRSLFRAAAASDNFLLFSLEPEEEFVCGATDGLLAAT